MEKGKYSAKAVANKFLELAIRDSSQDMSPMKIQKLIYFAHGWFMANFDSELIKDDIQAWKYGPVIPSIYHEFKSFGTDPITVTAKEAIYENGEISEISPEVSATDYNTIAIIEKTWEIYGKYTPVQLSNITHEDGSPWSAVNNSYPELPKGQNIPNSLIATHFKNLIKNANAVS